MARVQYGAMITGLIGSIRGMTYQNNSSGTIVRGRPQTRRTSTIQQTESHNTHIAQLQAWQTLSPSQKDEWTAYAAAWTKINKLGQTKKLTGQNWFESVNIKLNQIGAAAVTSPPAHVLPSAPPSFTIDITDDDFLLHFAEGFDYTNNAICVWATFPTKENNLSVNKIRRQIKVITADPAGAVNITSDWSNSTGLAWLPSTLFPNTNIVVCLQSVNKSSGISSAFLCNLAAVPEDGFLLTPDGQPLEDTNGNQLTQP